MPELPEVETILRGLKSQVVGRRIRDVQIGDRKVLQLKAGVLRDRTHRQTIRGLSRRGKYLIFELDLHYLIFHLGMTGQLTFRDPSRKDSRRFTKHPVTGLQRALQHAPDRHTHLQIQLDEGMALFYRDIRKFGKIFLIDKRQQNPLAVFFERLGLEPFTADYNIEAFLKGLRYPKRNVKSLLLDQGFVAGIGNIYADEALFEACIHPARRVRSLRRAEKILLFEAIPRVLERGIRHGGTSMRDYVNSDGERGSNQEELKVYGRQGEACCRCQTLIQKTIVSQRGTHSCPSCQPRRPGKLSS